MKKTTLFLLLLSMLSLSGYAAELINIDFTRDSVQWKSGFAAPAWNASKAELSVVVNNTTSRSCNFNGTWGKFNSGKGVMAQPQYIENATKNRRWAFRLDNTGNSSLELPTLASAGRFTVFCKNESPVKEGALYIQMKEGNTWKTIRTLYLPPHLNQNYEMQMEEFLNITGKVKLRLFGATTNIHVYEIRMDAFDKSVPKEKPLKLILIPDAQTYANRDSLNHIYAIQTMWVNSIADSVKFVIQQGDMTQLNNDPQWMIAAGAYNILEGRHIPFTYCSGNHDMGRHASSRNTDMMNTYLPYSRYSRHDYFGGAFEEGKVDNTWHTFSRGDYRFLVISLEFGPRNKVIEWAKTVIEQHPKYNIIINTHNYLGTDDKHRSGGVSAGEIGKATGDEQANDGIDIWNKLVSPYPNCLFVFCGHVTGKGIGNLISTGKHGNKVYQYLANYQGGVDGPQSERNGMLRIVDLYPENKSFTIKTYSPYTDKYKTEPGQEFHVTNVDFIKFNK